MPAITGSSLGYAGEVNELTGMNYWNRIGASKYGVAGANDLKVSKTTGDRMLLVSSGIAWGHNIEDTLQTSVSVQLNSVSSGSRWDLIVVRRDVTAGTTIEVVQGTSSKTLPSLTSTAASHPDQPLALCRVTADSTTVEEIVDLRCWASNGGVEVVDRLALDYLGTPGAAVKLGNTTWRYEARDNNVWAWDNGETRWADLTLGTTPGVAGVRGAGAWVRVGGTPAQARLVAGGTMIHVRGELSYVNTTTPTYMPAEGWVVARLPASMTPADEAFITGSSDTYRKSQLFVVKPNRDIVIGPGFAGKIAQFNGVAPA